MNIPIHQTLSSLSTSEPSFIIPGSTCTVCGKFVSSKGPKAWSNNNVLFSELERNQSECEVCYMVSAGLKQFRDEKCEGVDLPEGMNIRCNPGVSFKVVRAKSSNDPAEDVLGEEGLEFYVEPSKLSQ